CGYVISDPNQSKINFHIQTKAKVPSSNPIRKGLQRFLSLCQYVYSTSQQTVKAESNSVPPMEEMEKS
uniref:Uncharacterized protein n=1 Tax=Callorhinchus milii TaxID=7868 RepID=A0A4W3GYS7_CALMI